MGKRQRGSRSVRNTQEQATTLQAESAHKEQALSKMVRAVVASVIIPLAVSGAVALYSYRLQAEQRSLDRMETLMDEVVELKGELFRFDTSPEKRVIEMAEFQDDRGIVFSAAEHQAFVDRLNNLRIKMHLYYAPGTSAMLDSISELVVRATTGPSITIREGRAEVHGFKQLWLTVQKTRTLDDIFKQFVIQMANELESRRPAGSRGYWYVEGDVR